MILITHTNEHLQIFLLQRVDDDLKRKGDDMDRMADLSQDLQNLLNVRLKGL